MYGDAGRAEGLEQDHHEHHAGSVQGGPQDARGVPQARSRRPIRLQPAAATTSPREGRSRRRRPTTPEGVFGFIVVMPLGPPLQTGGPK